MLKEILDEKHLSMYALSKKSDVPYSTVSDLVSGKTDIQNVSAMVLYKLSQALDLTMDQLFLSEKNKAILYLYNEGREVFCEMGNQKFSYLGPKNLIGFKRLNGNKSNCLYVECYYANENKVVYTEEDYIDLADLFEEYDAMNLLCAPYEVILGRPKDSKQQYLLHNAFLISDNMAMLFKDNGTKDILVEVSNVKRNNEKFLVRMKDYAILSTNMGPALQKRALEAVKRNEELIYEEAKEWNQYA